MTDTTAGTTHATGIAATLGHVRYVLAGNPVTAFAFALFALIVLGDDRAVRATWVAGRLVHRREPT